MTTAAKPKKIPSKLTKVEIVGGKLTATIYAATQRAWDVSLASFNELAVNAATDPTISGRAHDARDALAQLSIALGFQGLPDQAKSTKPEERTATGLQAQA